MHVEQGYFEPFDGSIGLAVLLLVALCGRVVLVAARTSAEAEVGPRPVQYSIVPVHFSRYEYTKTKCVTNALQCYIMLCNIL